MSDTIMTALTDDRPNVPTLRFSEFEGEWKEERLGSVGKTITGFAFKSENFTNAGIPIIRISNISAHKRQSEMTTAVRHPPVLSIPDRFIIRNGEILIALSGATTGKACIYEFTEEAYLNQRVGVYRPYPTHAVNEFIRQIVFSKKFKSDVDATVIAGAQPNISPKEIDQFSYFMPPTPEQKKIAEFLGAVDERLDALRKKRDLLADYKRGAMQKIFNQEIRFTRDDGSAYPDWKLDKLEAHFSERSEKNFPKLQLLSVSLRNGVYIANLEDRKTNRPADLSNYKRVCVGDIAYNSMRMWQGASGVSQLEGIVSPAYTVLTPSSDQNPDFWGFYFKHKPVIQLFQRHSQGLTSDTWNLKFPALSRIKLTTPHPDEQKKIADFLSAIDDKINAVDDQISETEAFKKGLLQQMFV